MAFNFEDKLFNDEYSPQSTLIVDSLNLAFRWKHQGRSDFRYEFESTVQSLAKSYGTDRVIITADWGASSYRKIISGDYKQNRKEKIAEQTEEERIAFEEFFEEFEASLEVMKEGGYVVLRYKGVEADDLAGHLVKYKDKYGLGDIWLISSDRDWDLLVQEGVSRFSYVTRKEVTLENWSSHYDCTPEEYISVKCLMGDKGDNVAGFPGIGIKRAVSLVKEYGSAYDIYEAVPIHSKYKFIQGLNENPEQILKNYELMDLLTYCDDALGATNFKDIRGRMLDGL
jgi:5'-3' exonuclease